MRATGCEASAPGKLILMGEHAAVYGRPALVAAIGLRTRARMEPAGSGGLLLDLPDLAIREELTWQDVVEFGSQRREEWLRWHSRAEDREGGVPSRLPAPGSSDESGLVKVAVAESLRILERDGDVDKLPSSSLSVSSEVPRGAGFGSSASVAVAVGAAFLGSLAASTGEPVHADDERIASVALEVEKRQHGRPSGVDHTAVIRGGFLAVVREADGIHAAALPRPEWLSPAIRVFDTGTPAESTGQVVEAVRRLHDQAPGAFSAQLDRMEHATTAFMTGLERGEAPWPVLLAAIQTFERCLEDLGVVPAPVARAVRGVEAAGGAAKISGAGCLSGGAAGSLLVLWPPEVGSDADLESMLEGYRPIEASLGSAGVDLIGDADA